MPILSALVVSLFGSLAAFFAKFMVARTAVGVAAISVFAALTLAFTAGIATAISAVAWSGALPAPVILGISFFMPSNLPVCVSAIFAMDIAAALYRWNVENNSLLLGR